MKNKVEFKQAYFKSSLGVVTHFEHAVIMNLLHAKGANMEGELLYLHDPKTTLQEPDQAMFKDKIVVCDHLEISYYPIISAMSAKGVITNTIDYSGYKDIVVLKSSIGVFGGFGNAQFETVMKNYFHEKHGKKAYFDVTYQKLIIEEEKEPSWLKDYMFDLKPIIGYK